MLLRYTIRDRPFDIYAGGVENGLPGFFLNTIEQDFVLLTFACDLNRHTETLSDSIVRDICTLLVTEG